MIRHTLSLLLAAALTASPLTAAGFDVTAIGVRGGVDDGNLTAWMIASQGQRKAVMCDAGSLVNGIAVARRKGSLKGPIETILHDDIAGYLISHPHLDHVAGMLIASPDDSAKSVYALPSVSEALLDSYFNGTAWANFTDRGKPPRLGKYKLVDLAPGRAQPIAGTAMDVTAYPLAHGGIESTAFMIGDGGDAILCLGDTGADAVEGHPRLAGLWQVAGPLVAAHRLKAIIIEVSYPSERPEKLLFGHLTPALLLGELHKLETAAGGKGSLKGLRLIVSHIKPALTGPDPRTVIARQLAAGNDLGIDFIIPTQGQRWTFR
jgi:3',5'-cyclic-nucleotide phosphodiesterase